ncbi:hypothetical protein H4R18_003130, partial [Coemansia javaensis]
MLGRSRVVASALRQRPGQRGIHTYSCQNADRGGSGRPPMSFEKVILRGGSPYLTKAFQMLPRSEQAALQSFSDMLADAKTSGSHLGRHYALLRSAGLHQHLTVHAMQRLIRRTASEVELQHAAGGEQPSDAILRMINDYGAMGFSPGVSEYSSLIRALALEPGREAEVLRLVDSIVDSSELAPFLRAHRGRSGPVESRVPSDEEIARIDMELERAELEAAAQHAEPPPPQQQQQQDAADSGADQIQSLVSKQVLARHQDGGKRPMQISRSFYHMAMRGFAQIYHVRGVLEILSRMLGPASLVPHRIARHLMPNKETWDIVAEVLSRQRDQPTLVRAWIGFLSRGARPPIGLTRAFVRLLVQHSCVEQAVWAMRISRCLPDLGERPAKTSFSEDAVPRDLRVRVMHVASALEAAALMDAAQVALGDVLRRGRAAMELPALGKPDPEIYAYLIGGAVRVHSAGLAETLFRELVDAGVAPASATYGHLAELYADRKQTARLFMIVREMLIQRSEQTAAERLGDALGGSPEAQARYNAAVRRKTSLLRVDVECIVPLLRLYLQNGREPEALALLRSWDMAHSDHVPAGKLALALARVYRRPEDTAAAKGITQRLLRTLADEKEAAPDHQAPPPPADGAGPPADASTMMHVHLQTIRTHFRARNIPGVIQVMRDMAAGDLVPSHAMWDTIMRGFLHEQALDLFDAVRVFVRDVLRMPLSLPLYAQWMQALRNHGDVVGVQMAFDEMVSLGQVPSVQHYLCLVRAYACDGWVEQAVAIVNSLRRPQSALQPDLRLDAAVIEAYVSCGDMERAEAELKFALSNTHLPMNRVPAQLFNHMIVGYLHAGNGEQAMRTYEEMVRLGVKPDIYTFSVLMQSYAAARDLANCMRVFNEMIRVGISPDIVVYTIMICAFGIARKTTNAEVVFGQLLREQEWARSQASSSSEGRRQQQQQQSTPANSPEALDAYADILSATAALDSASAFDDSRGTDGRPRMRGFYNLDPVVYIAMLSVYRKTGRTMRALATWQRMITNYPVVQWNPRQGGILSKTLHYTGQFHLPAWTLVLRTAQASIGALKAINRLGGLDRYFTAPLFPEPIAMVRALRLRQRRAILDFLRSGTRDPAAPVLARRMEERVRAIETVEAELDARVSIDRGFVLRWAHRASPPSLDRLEPFADLGHWIPETVVLPQGPPAGPAAPDPQFPFIRDDGTFSEGTPQTIAAAVARMWRSLEDDRFKFNNLHVVSYIPCLLVGRQYAELLRFLLLVEPESAAAAPESERARYRYRNIDIGTPLTHLLIRQLISVRAQLEAQCARRVLLSALLKTDAALHASYASESVYGLVNKQRTGDERRAMHERLAVYSEHELSWAAELRALVD